MLAAVFPLPIKYESRRRHRRAIFRIIFFKYTNVIGSPDQSSFTHRKVIILFHVNKVKSSKNSDTKNKFVDWKNLVEKIEGIAIFG